MDLFEEIRGDIVRQKYAHIWQKFGLHFVIALVILIAAVSVYLFVKQNNEKQLRKTSFLYAQMLKAQYGQDQHSMLLEMAKVHKKGEGSLVTFAELKKAAILLNNGKRKEALKIYQTIAEDDDINQESRDLAILLLLKNDNSWSAEISPNLANQIDEAIANHNIFYYSLIELKALYFVRKSLYEKAFNELDKIITDQAAPSANKARAEALKRTFSALTNNK
jgi:hypothetical protein